MPQMIAGPDVVGKACPFCHAALQPGGAVYVCESCYTPHHIDCWKANAGCTRPGCPRAAGAAATTFGYQPSPPGYQAPGGYQAPPSAQGYNYAAGSYAGGQPTAADLGGWNWGAFMFSWIWGLNHRAYWTLLALVPYIGLVVAIVSGVMGNRWAWESGRFSSVQEMQATQNVWRTWAIVFFALSLLFGGLIGVIAVIAAARSSSY
ncbi:MAG TPA: RING finger protein [Armatimonadota bacterium]|jgi:hypothetical protein